MSNHWFAHPLAPKILVFVIPFLLYLNTITHDYALDDAIVITENQFVQNGFRGLKDIFTHDTFVGFFKKKKELVAGGRYRPLSLASFAVEESLGLGSPGFRHFGNALLYALVCLALYQMIIRLLRYFSYERFAIPVALLSVLIYAVHPIHTEVVANIKGRDELLATLFLLLALTSYIKLLQLPETKEILLISLFLFSGLLAKENAIAFIPLAIILPMMKKVNGRNKLFAAWGGIVLVSSVYLILRFKFAGGFQAGMSSELMNNPFLGAESRYPTVFYTLLLYLKLLVFPYPLTFDYYPYHIEIQGWANPMIYLSILLYMLFLVIAIRNFRKQPVISFAVFFFLFSLFPVSNLVVNVGTFMNERFLFIPSAGFALLFGWFISKLYFQSRNQLKTKSIQIAFLLLIAVLSLQTVSRNKVWKDNETLFLTDNKTSRGSAKGNCMAGGILYEKAKEMKEGEARTELLQQSSAYLERAIEIYPEYVDALLLLGNVAHLRDTNYTKSVACYERIFNLQPGYTLAFQNLKKILSTAKNPQIRINGFKTILKYRPKDFDANYELGSTYGKMLNEIDSAMFYLTRAAEIRPNEKVVLRDLGVANAMSGRFKESIFYFRKVIELDPKDPSNYINLGISYQKTGETELAAEMFTKAKTLSETK